MKLTIEIDKEDIGSLQDWAGRHGGIITETEELGDTCYVQVLSPGDRRTEAWQAFQSVSGFDEEACRKFVLERDPIRIRTSIETGRKMVEALNNVGASTHIGAEARLE